MVPQLIGEMRAMSAQLPELIEQPSDASPRREGSVDQLIRIDGALSTAMVLVH